MLNKSIPVIKKVNYFDRCSGTIPWYKHLNDAEEKDLWIEWDAINNKVIQFFLITAKPSYQYKNANSKDKRIRGHLIFDLGSTFSLPHPQTNILIPRQVKCVHDKSYWCMFDLNFQNFLSCQ